MSLIVFSLLVIIIWNDDISRMVILSVVVTISCPMVMAVSPVDAHACSVDLLRMFVQEVELIRLGCF